MRFDLRPLRLTTGWSEPNAVVSRTLSVEASFLMSCTRFYCNFALAYKINKKVFVAINSCIKAGSEFALSIFTTFRLNSKTTPCLGQKFLSVGNFFYYFIVFGFYKFKTIFSFLRGCFSYVLEFKVFEMTGF